MLARRLGWLVAGLGVAGLALSNACSASPDNNTFDGTGAGNPSGTGAGNGNGATGSGGDPLFDGGNGSTGTGVGGGCAGDSIKAEKIPLDMYIMLDQSGSMSDPVSGGGDKWGATTSAITAFVNQPQLVGLGVGIQYFGLPAGGMQCPSTCNADPDCGACGPCFVFPGIPGICLGASGGDSCNASDYANPEVPIAELPGVASAITASMANHSPTTSTPTSAALQGAVDYAKSWASSHPDHVVIAVLATDGDPTECDTNLANINAIAAAGVNGTPKILTFVIGVGPSLNALNGIAAAGGTGQAYIVDTNGNATQQFIDALNDIQGQVLGCNYTIPLPEAGTPDYATVNVQYTPGGGGEPQTFPKVSGLADCPPGGDAWYYDNNAAPTQIVLCPDTCTKVSADTMGEVKIVLGCETIVN